jgi:hypothetical protein
MPLASITLPNNLNIQGDVNIAGTVTGVDRTSLEMDDDQRYKIPLTEWRVWDALATNLPGTPAADDLGLVGGTFGTASPAIQTGDLKAAGSTVRYARCQFVLPPEYVAAQSVTIRAHAGMVTTVSDGTATIDFQAYRSDDEAGIGSDLVTTAATTINSLTEADKDFALTATTLNPGDTLDIRMAVTIADAATATAVVGNVGAVEVLLDIKG